MHAGTKARVAFEVVTWSVAVLVVTVWVMGVAGLALFGGRWSEPLFIAFGIFAGLCLGAIRDRRVFQVSLAAIALVSIVCALWLASSGSAFQEAAAVFLYPFLASSVWTFVAVLALARLWGRKRPEPVPTPEEIDQTVARPRLGV
jgi:hypothetical protein